MKINELKQQQEVIKNDIEERLRKVISAELVLIKGDYGAIPNDIIFNMIDVTSYKSDKQEYLFGNVEVQL